MKNSSTKDLRHQF